MHGRILSHETVELKPSAARAWYANPSRDREGLVLYLRVLWGARRRIGTVDRHHRCAPAARLPSIPNSVFQLSLIFSLVEVAP